jgi:ribosomal protein L2
MPEGTVVCQLEEYNGDRGKLARASGKNKILLSKMMNILRCCATIFQIFIHSI